MSANGWGRADGGLGERRRACLLADLLVVEGNPLTDPAVLRSRERIWLVLQLGEPVAGAALETRP